MHYPILARWTFSLLLAFASVTFLGIGQAHAAAKTKADPAQIARGVHQWTGFLAKRAAAAKKPALAKGNKRAAPFWEAVKRLSAASSQLERDLTAKRSGYLKALGDARSALASVKVGYQQSGAKNAGIDKALTNIDRGVTLLERHAGPAKAGKSGGKGLSAKQKRQFDALKAKQAELKRKLRGVESKVGKNKAAIRAIRDIRSRSDRIYHSRNTAADYFAALMAARVIDGLLWGWHWWWGPWGGWIDPWCGGFVDVYYDSISVIDIDMTVIDVDIDIEDYALDADIDQVELDAVDDELSSGDFDLSEAEIDTIADDGFGDGAGDLEMETLPEPELPGEGEAVPEIDLLPEPEALPEVDTLPEPEPLPVPELESFPEPVAEPMPIDNGGGFEGGGFDGGGFDDGGFDGGGFDGGGFDGGGFDGGGFDGGGDF